MNRGTYPNIEKVVRATDVLLGWVFGTVKLLLLLAVVVAVVAVLV